VSDNGHSEKELEKSDDGHGHDFSIVALNLKRCGLLAVGCTATSATAAAAITFILLSTFT
jgi:hypothetical protein